jgi:hypothetical protein
VVSTAAAVAVLVGFLVESSASAARPVLLVGRGVSPGASAAVGASSGWGVGLEAVLPANAATKNQNAQLVSVSCPSAGNCSAVGLYTDNSGNTEGLLMSETAGLWAPGVEAVPPANANSSGTSRPESVSCASPGNCSAVGEYGGGSGLLLTETAGRWAKGVKAVLPANAAQNQPLLLFSVSCALAGNCSAVGWYTDDSGHTEGLLLNERDGRWATGVEAKVPANAAGTPQSALFSVSCARTGDCTAVGDYYGNGYSDGLLLTETRGNWRRGVAANAATAITSVSCSSPGNCGAVGGNPAQGLLLTQTGGKWAKGVKAVLPANAITTDAEQLMGLNSISCSSPGYCSAVGTYTDDTNTIQGLLLTEAADTWASGVEALPANFEGAPTVSQGLSSISCSSPGNCSAVGNYLSSSTSKRGLLLTENAGTWETGVDASLPTNAGTGPPTLNAVSCPLPGNCGVVGDYYTTEDPSGFFVGGLLIGDSSPLVQLEVLKTGAGSGTVSSLPAGIRCGTTCSASFDAGGSLTLTATPSPGSRFIGWSGAGICSETKSCQINDLAGNQTVTATFGLLSRCVVPKLMGKTLKTAEHTITARNCAVGRIRHATSPTIKKGYVLSQSPAPGRRLRQGANVNLVVSSGDGDGDKDDGNADSHGR